jgi:hypothetical protein
MESKKKKKVIDRQVYDAAKKKTVEKFYQQVIKNFGYEYQRRA